MADPPSPGGRWFNDFAGKMFLYKKLGLKKDHGRVPKNGRYGNFIQFSHLVWYLVINFVFKDIRYSYQEETLQRCWYFYDIL